jgi:hypothetical protein
MGIIVCQTCEKTIDHFDDEKVSTLYGVCSRCHDCHHEDAEKKVV